MAPTGGGQREENIALVLAKRYAPWRRTKKDPAPGRGLFSGCYSYGQIREVMGGLDTE